MHHKEREYNILKIQNDLNKDSKHTIINIA